MSFGWASNLLADIVIVGGAVAGIGTAIDKFVRKSTKQKITKWCEDKWIRLSYVSTLPFLSNLPKRKFYIGLLIVALFIYIVMISGHLYYLHAYYPERFEKLMQYPNILIYPASLFAASLIVAFVFGPIYLWVVKGDSGWLILLKSAGIWLAAQIPGFVFAYGLATGMWNVPEISIQAPAIFGFALMVFLCSISLSLFFLLSVAVFVLIIFLTMVPIGAAGFVLRWMVEYESGPVLGAAVLASGAVALAKVFL